MGTKEVKSLKGKNARKGSYQPPYIRNSNHPANTFLAGFFDVVEGAPRSHDFAQNGMVEGLLFGQDAPIWIEAQTRYFGFTTPAAPEVITNIEDTPVLVNQYSNPAPVVTLDPALPAYLQVLRGETHTNDLLVTGYGFRYLTDDLGILDTATPAVGHGTLKVITQASQCYGPPAAVIGQGVGGSIYLPIILNEANYTKAIQDAGNVFARVSGQTTYVYTVVGIFNETTRQQG
jgi:hypothetical protein